MTPKFGITKCKAHSVVTKHEAVFKKPPGAATPADVLPAMTATETDTADVHQSRGTQAQTHFDARAVLEGALDDTTVRQAVQVSDRR